MPLERTLHELVDLQALNAGIPRFSATAVDLQSGEDVVFDTSHHELTAHHLRASSALLPVFPPVEIGGRILGDAGISANLPLDVMMSEASDDRPLLCIAIDLFPLEAPSPDRLGDTAARMQDLIFALQSRRTIAAWQAIFKERDGSDDAPGMTLLHLVYSNHSREVSGKAFDYSVPSAATRWKAGYEDLRGALDQLAVGTVAMGQSGLQVYRWSHTDNEAGVLRNVQHALEPTRG
jgi:NTE family protein